MILFIDTSAYNSATFSLTGGKKPLQKSVSADPQESFKLLSHLERFLKSAKAGRESVEKIVVNTGPGSYTGVRVGVTHAKAIGLAWDVPVSLMPKTKFDPALARAMKG